jgi:hypothetical protein
MIQLNECIFVDLNVQLDLMYVNTFATMPRHYHLTLNIIRIKLCGTTNIVVKI